MSVVGAAMRAAIEARAENRCEYCHLPVIGQVATFPIDHIVPRSNVGATDLSNLALACPHCNAQKWIHQMGIDPATASSVPLFHPRRDIWSDHFQWSDADSVVLEGKTSCGRATIDRLRMNDPKLIEIRRLLMQLDLFSADR